MTRLRLSSSLFIAFISGFAIATFTFAYVFRDAEYGAPPLRPQDIRWSGLYNGADGSYLLLHSSGHAYMRGTQKGWDAIWRMDRDGARLSMTRIFPGWYSIERRFARKFAAGNDVAFGSSPISAIVLFPSVFEVEGIRYEK